MADSCCELRRQLAELLQTSLLVPEDVLYLDFVESGAVDSAGFMELFFVLEKVFGIEVEAEDLTLDNFRSIERLAEFVFAKQRGFEQAPPIGDLHV